MHAALAPLLRSMAKCLDGCGNALLALPDDPIPFAHAAVPLVLLVRLARACCLLDLAVFPGALPRALVRVVGASGRSGGVVRLPLPERCDEGDDGTFDGFVGYRWATGVVRAGAAAMGGDGGIPAAASGSIGVPPEWASLACSALAAAAAAGSGQTESGSAGIADIDGGWATTGTRNNKSSLAKTRSAGVGCSPPAAQPFASGAASVPGFLHWAPPNDIALLRAVWNSDVLGVAGSMSMSGLTDVVDLGLVFDVAAWLARMLLGCYSGGGAASQLGSD